MEASSETGADLREELRSDAHTVTDSAKQKLRAEADARKGTAAEQAKSLSSALDTAAGELSDSPAWLRSAFRQGAETLQRLGDTIERKDSRELTREVQQIAREHPGPFLAGCAAAGFAAARLLKAGVEDSGNAAPTGASSRAYDPYEPQSSAPRAHAYGGMSNPQAAEPTYVGDLP